MYQSKIQQIFTRFQKEPYHKVIFMKILSNCQEPKSFLRIQEIIHTFPEITNAILTPEVMLKWLEEDGGIQQVKLQEQFCWQTTPEGNFVLQQEAPQKKLAHLLKEEPDRKPVYLKVLDFCEKARTRNDVIEYLENEPILEKQQVFPTMFLQRLEKTGAIRWENSRWLTSILVDKSLLDASSQR